MNNFRGKTMKVLFLGVILSLSFVKATLAAESDLTDGLVWGQGLSTPSTKPNLSLYDELQNIEIKMDEPKIVTQTNAKKDRELKLKRESKHKKAKSQTKLRKAAKSHDRTLKIKKTHRKKKRHQHTKAKRQKRRSPKTRHRKRKRRTSRVTLKKHRKKNKKKNWPENRNLRIMGGLHSARHSRKGKHALFKKSHRKKKEMGLQELDTRIKRKLYSMIKKEHRLKTKTRKKHKAFKNLIRGLLQGKTDSSEFKKLLSNMTDKSSSGNSKLDDNFKILNNDEEKFMEREKEIIENQRAILNPQTYENAKKTSKLENTEEPTQNLEQPALETKELNIPQETEPKLENNVAQPQLPELESETNLTTEIAQNKVSNSVQNIQNPTNQLEPANKAVNLETSSDMFKDLITPELLLGPATSAIILADKSPVTVEETDTIADKSTVSEDLSPRPFLSSILPDSINPFAHSKEVPKEDKSTTSSELDLSQSQKSTDLDNQSGVVNKTKEHLELDELETELVTADQNKKVNFPTEESPVNVKIGSAQAALEGLQRLSEESDELTEHEKLVHNGTQTNAKLAESLIEIHDFQLLLEEFSMKYFLNEEMYALFKTIDPESKESFEQWKENTSLRTWLNQLEQNKEKVFIEADSQIPREEIIVVNSLLAFGKDDVKPKMSLLETKLVTSTEKGDEAGRHILEEFMYQIDFLEGVSKMLDFSHEEKFPKQDEIGKMKEVEKDLEASSLGEDQHTASHVSTSSDQLDDQSPDKTPPLTSPVTQDTSAKTVTTTDSQSQIVTEASPITQKNETAHGSVTSGALDEASPSNSNHDNVQETVLDGVDTKKYEAIETESHHSQDIDEDLTEENQVLANLKQDNIESELFDEENVLSSQPDQRTSGTITQQDTEHNIETSVVSNTTQSLNSPKESLDGSVGSSALDNASVHSATNKSQIPVTKSQDQNIEAQSTSSSALDENISTQTGTQNLEASVNSQIESTRNQSNASQIIETGSNKTQIPITTKYEPIQSDSHLSENEDLEIESVIHTDNLISPNDLEDADFISEMNEDTYNSNSIIHDHNFITSNNKPILPNEHIYGHSMMKDPYGKINTDAGSVEVEEIAHSVRSSGINQAKSATFLGTIGTSVGTSMGTSEGTSKPLTQKGIVSLDHVKDIDHDQTQVGEEDTLEHAIQTMSKQRIKNIKIGQGEVIPYINVYNLGESPSTTPIYQGKRIDMEHAVNATGGEYLLKNNQLYKQYGKQNAEKIAQIMYQRQQKASHRRTKGPKIHLQVVKSQTTSFIPKINPSVSPILQPSHFGNTDHHADEINVQQMILSGTKELQHQNDNDNDHLNSMMDNLGTEGIGSFRKRVVDQHTPFLGKPNIHWNRGNQGLTSTSLIIGSNNNVVHITDPTHPPVKRTPPHPKLGPHQNLMSSAFHVISHETTQPKKLSPFTGPISAMKSTAPGKIPCPENDKLYKHHFVNRIRRPGNPILPTKNGFQDLFGKRAQYMAYKQANGAQIGKVGMDKKYYSTQYLNPLVAANLHPQDPRFQNIPQDNSGVRVETTMHDMANGQKIGHFVAEIRPVKPHGQHYRKKKKNRKLKVKKHRKSKSKSKLKLKNKSKSKKKVNRKLKKHKIQVQNLGDSGKEERRLRLRDRKRNRRRRSIKRRHRRKRRNSRWLREKRSLDREIREREKELKSSERKHKRHSKKKHAKFSKNKRRNLI